MKRQTSLSTIAAGAAAAGFVLVATAGVAAAEPTPTTTTPPTTTTTPPSSTTTPPSSTTTTGPTASEPSTGVAHLSVSPSRAHPGDSVLVRLSCLGDRGAVKSAALSIGGSDGAAGSVYTHATVRSVDPGTYKVSASCGDQMLTTSLRVLGTTPSTPSPSQVSTVPKGSVDTGDGSLAATRDDAAQTPLLVGGLAIVAGGGLAGYAALRRRADGTTRR